MDTRIVRVRSLRGGHYRGGRHFGAAPQDIEARTLSRKQLAALQDDPDLSVEIVQDGEAAATDNPAA
ncbi:hypothetical protein [Solidesulfovibrio carbinolicus]|uniref:Mu-like prophage FluMu N-terminal domain-containing protein n=1 Tax=Solidesulfovibrio carbinolicus TaxID=296842 RepID=A0A4P6HNC1_9BACT|nr:hypothetical protein [Solidesulfovibrio carbinolicus]QAZ68256.1 hypothetical protein C3Y92_13905 [Solidesulfovibrio carbinolicus]